jgi:hypothetical protein
LPVGDIANWITALVGVAAGAGVSSGKDWLSNRADLVYDLGQVREKVWVDRTSGQGLRATEEGFGDLVITVDVLFINRAGRDNAVVEAWVEQTPSRQRIDARLYLDEAFTGCNVRTHSLSHVRLRFLLPSGDAAKHRPQPELTLNFRAISGQVKPVANLKSPALRIEGLSRSNMPYDDVAFLRKRGARSTAG